MNVTPLEFHQQPYTLTSYAQHSVRDRKKQHLRLQAKPPKGT